MSAPRFIAVFKPSSMIARDVEKGVIDQIIHIAYDDTGQRWGFVERLTAPPEGSPRWTVRRSVGRGWVRLPTKILDEEWEPAA